jgi:DNA-binding NarL/FixJ family response regulator
MSTLSPHVIVLDDHPLVGRGLVQYLTARWPDVTVHEARHWDDVLRLADQHGCPAVLLADVWLEEGNSLERLAAWRARCPSSPWLAISGDDDPAIAQRVRTAGAQGFVHKQATPETFGLALQALLDGLTWFDAPAQAPVPPAPREWPVSASALGLTARQGEILQLLLRGLPNKRIASQLDIAESTVKEHVTGILERLGVRTRVEAITLLRGRRLELP